MGRAVARDDSAVRAREFALGRSWCSCRAWERILTSDLLGGSKTILIGNLVQNQFTASRDWPFGAAASLALMIVAMALLFAARRRGEELL